MSELKPCPFCGWHGDSLDFIADASQGYKWGSGYCPECGATSGEVRTGYDTSENAEWHEEAIAAWNRRHD